MITKENSYIDGNPIVRHFSPSCCTRCKHFDGVENGTCSAYPNGIPSRFADLITGANAPQLQIHTSVEKDQVGEYVWDFI